MLMLHHKRHQKTSQNYTSQTIALATAGAKEVARLLRYYTTACPVLSNLQLFNCGIGNEGGMSLACALAAPNVKIEYFYVSHNLMDEDGVSAFIQTLQSNNRTLIMCRATSHYGSKDPSMNQLQRLIDHYCRLNSSGRHKWGDVKLNAALWPHILSRTGTYQWKTLDWAFAILRDRPDFLMTQPSQSTP